MEREFFKPDDSIESQKNDYIGFLFQLITISITCASIFFLIRTAIKQPTPIEDRILVKTVTPEKLAASSLTPVRVKTGLLIRNFREFDLIANNFVFEGEIWFEFDPSCISIDTLSNFSFEKGEIKSIGPAKTRLVNNHLLVRYDLVVKFSTDLNYAFFPIDDHSISLILINIKVSPHEVIFESNNQEFIINAETRSYGWNRYYHNVSTGYMEDSIDKQASLSYAAPSSTEHPAVQFSLYYVRSGLKYALIIVLPMLVFIIVMLTAFSYDSQKYFSSIMVANGASLSGLIGFRFVIENMSPKVGYFMISDCFFLVFLSLAATLFLIGIFSMSLTTRAKRYLLLLVHATLICSFAIIVWVVLKYSFYVTEVV